MRDLTLIADALAECEALGEPAVLATVVRTEGSTYRRTGARMLLRASGRTTGAVSGGCLEADLAARVGDLLAAGQAELVTYDTRTADDLVWGLGLGCNGRVDVLLEPLAGEALAWASRLHARCRDLATPAVLTTVIVAAQERLRVGDRLLLTESGEVLCSGIAPEAMPPEIVADAREALAARRSAVRAYGPAGNDVAGLEVVHEVLSPPLSLLVCGAGADAVPLVCLAVGLGWQVTVIDHRPLHARPDRFPGATVLLADQVAPAVEAGRGCDAAVVMSHNYERDLAQVRALLAAGVAYVGVLGPRRRTLRMIDDLGLSAADAARLYAPVGLDIGAETPEEIALAIVAEVQAVKSRRRGAPLRARPGAIHDESLTMEPPPAAPVAAVVLAAGDSSRFGRPKQLVVYEGLSLVARAAQAARETGADPVIVVLGANAAAVRGTLSGIPVTPVVNPDWDTGMGTSVAAGVRAIVDHAPSARAVLVMLADQPLVGGAVLGRLVDTWTCSDARSCDGGLHATIAAAAYADTIGVPAVFGRAHFNALCSLPAIVGAARLLRDAGARVCRVPMPEATVDIDTPNDLERLVSKIGGGNDTVNTLARAACLG